MLISMPDGAGCQNLTLVAQRGREHAIALCLLKRGHGVKDAFVIPCKSKADQRRIVDEMDFEVPLLPVTPALALQSLGRALSDGIAAGALPSPGLLDVADLMGAPVPTAMDTRALLAAIGPATEHLLTTKARIASLAGRQSETVWDDALFDSWFEQTEGLDARLADATTLKAARDVVWQTLAERRLWWARAAGNFSDCRRRITGVDAICQRLHGGSGTKPAWIGIDPAARGNAGGSASNTRSLCRSKR